MASYRKSGVRLLDENDLLEMERVKEDQLAPAVTLPAPPPGPEEEIERAPSELKSTTPEPEYRPERNEELEAYKTQLATAREQAAQRRMLAGIGRAGAGLIEATTGVKGDDDFYKSLETAADEPTRQAKEDFEIAKYAKGLREKEAQKNPNSPYNRAAQEQLKKVAPTLAKTLGEVNLARMTKDDLDKALGTDQKEREIASKEKSAEALVDWRKAQDENSDARLQQQQDEFEFWKPLRKYQAETGRIAATKVPFGTLLSSTTAGQRQFNHETGTLVDYHKDVEKLRPLYALFEEIERLAPGLTIGNVPEGLDFGSIEHARRRLPGGWGARFSDKNSTLVNSLYEKLRTDIQHGTAGASLTPQEKAPYDRIFQDTLGAPADVKAAAIAVMRNMLQRKLKASRAAYKPGIPDDMWNQYIVDGGMSSDSSLFGPPPRPSAAPAAPPSSGGPPKPKNPLEGKLGPPVRVRILDKASPNYGKIGSLPKAAADAAIAAGKAELVK